MKVLLADLPILAKLLLLPAIAAALMVLLGGLYVIEQRETVTLQERISGRDVPRLSELSRLFSQFSTNHVQFISLLALSLRSPISEGRLGRAPAHPRRQPCHRRAARRVARHGGRRVGPRNRAAAAKASGRVPRPDG